jgi:pimeloyl-ACP methyl ester carboxylesterase
VPKDTIFLHGNLASNTWWKPAVAVWQARAKDSSQKGRLILAEWRGCGKSTGPNEEKELAPDNLAADYNALLDHLQIRKASLVGHSTGGLIGLIAMHQRPDLYERAVLLDSVSHQGVQFPPEMFGAFTQMSQDRAFCEVVMTGTVHGTQLSEELKKQIVDDAFGVHPLIWHGVPKALDKVDISSRLPQIHQSILVLHGEHDSVLPKERSQELARLLPNGKFFEIPGRGHSTNVENPVLFVEMVDSFLFG